MPACSEGIVTPKRLLILLTVCIAFAGAMWPADALAQRRVVRRAPVRTVVVAGYARPYYPYYYDPFGFDWYGYQYRPYPPYSRYYYEPGADLRIQVTPREAEVYIDGYLAGNVDDFDGVFQRLHVPFGEHEISVYREGYRTITEKMLFRPYESYNIKQVMQPLGAGTAADPRPAPDPNASAQAQPRRGLPPNGRYPDRNPADRDPDRNPPERTPDRGADRNADRNADRFGSVAIRVQPGDAAVFIDGERWDTPAGEDRLHLELSEGTHRVEIRKDGFKPYASTIRVRAGETVTLNVSLPSGE
jgi:PEGA domain